MSEVLVVDDDPAVRDLLHCCGKLWGVPLRIASSGAEAMTCLIRQPDIPRILTDMDMPGMNGREFVERIRELGFHQPVWLMSGRLPSDVERRPFEGFLAKPFSLDRLKSLFGVDVPELPQAPLPVASETQLELALAACGD